ncbi:MAG: prepilin-type N-terminal cleavage/methylation domain-containing protein [Planctomycetota bacterium]|jgi:type II secretory pathway pseudopilin PulG
MKMYKKKQSSGFTLIEALFAAMLLGLVVAALAAASGAFTMAKRRPAARSPWPMAMVWI